MPAISPETRQRLIEATKEASAAFVEDISHIRRILARDDQDRSEIRNLSNIMRRLLTDNGGDLTKIAPPRIGKFAFDAPDNSDFYTAFRKRHVSMFVSGGPRLFGLEYRALSSCTPPLNTNDANPNRSVKLYHDNFINQRVIALHNQWATRKDAIKHIALFGSGVHSLSPKENIDLMLARVRQALTLTFEDGGTRIEFDEDAFLGRPLSFKGRKTGVDGVLMEVYSSAYYLANSQDTKKLESHILSELS